MNPAAAAIPMPVRRRLERVGLAAGFWTAVGLVFVLPQLAQGTDWRALLLASLAQWWCWGLLAPAILAIDRKLPFSGAQVGRRVVAHLVLGPMFTIADVYLLASIKAATGTGRWSHLASGALPAEALRGMFWSMLVYCLIVGTWRAHIYQQSTLSAELRMERLERNFSEVRLNLLRMQLDPHFLFNALNTISAQVAREPRLARTMIEHLGDLLRLSLDSQDRHEIPLAQELAFLEHYLAIQRIRFGDKLTVILEITPDARNAAVPSLFLQPLVENAIRHGISERLRGGCVTVTARRIAGQLAIRISDDGVGLPPLWPIQDRSIQDGPGLGLALTRERVAALHPDGSGSFAIGRRAEGGTVVDVSFPFRVVGAEHGRSAA